MTPTSTSDNSFRAPTTRISLEQIEELKEKLITSYLDTMYLLRQRSKESEDANNLNLKITSYLNGLYIRDMSDQDFKRMAVEINTSPVLKWSFMRMIAAIRAVSFGHLLVDQYIHDSYNFYSLSKIDNEYAFDELNIIETYNKYQFMKVLALFELLNIYQEIEYRRESPPEYNNGG